jgi:hypothetical protein
MVGADLSEDDDGIRIYNFARQPPADVRVYFTERHLEELAVLGVLPCPYVPHRLWRDRPLLTPFCGRWMVDIAGLSRPYDYMTDGNNIVHPVNKALADRLITYEDIITGDKQVWRLTEKMILRDPTTHGNADLRLGVWPD